MAINPANARATLSGDEQERFNSVSGGISALSHQQGGYYDRNIDRDVGGRAKRKSMSEYALLGGGGVSVGPNGELTDPDALPMWDPLNSFAGPGSAYLNLLRPPSEPGQVTNATLSGAVLPRVAAGPQTRDVPGMANVDDSRFRLQGAASGVGSAGEAARAQQAMLPLVMRANAQPSLGVTNQLLREGGAVGAGAAAGQGALTGLLAQRAIGQGPSAAQAVLQQGMSRNVGAMMGVAANARGGAAGGAMRQAQLGGQQLGLQTQAQAAELAANEQIAAQDMLSGHLSGVRGQDVGTMVARAGVANQAGDLALRRDLGVAGVLGQTREQDLAREATRANVLAGLRSGDIDAAALGIDARQLDDVAYQAMVMNALGLGELQQRGGAADAEAMLKAAGIMQDHQANRRAGDTGRMQANTARRQQDINLVQDIATGVGAGAAGLVGGPGAAVGTSAALRGVR